MAQWNLFLVFLLTMNGHNTWGYAPNTVFQRSYHPMKRIYGVWPALIHHNTPIFSSSIHRSMTPQACSVYALKVVVVVLPC